MAIKKNDQTEGTFDRFRAEAGAREPYVITTDDDTRISIPPLKAGQILDLTEEFHRPRRALEILCGDQFSRVYDLVKNEEIETFNNLIADMAAHFGMGDSPSGDGVN